jgi:phage terminase small subunit
MPEKKLTGKQMAFIAAYIANGFNATEACKTAGYSAKSRGSLGSQAAANLQNAAIMAELKRQLSEREVTPERVIGQLDAIAVTAPDARDRIAALKALQQALIGTKHHHEHEVSGDIVVEGRVWTVDEDGRPVALGEFSSRGDDE